MGLPEHDRSSCERASGPARLAFPLALLSAGLLAQSVSAQPQQPFALDWHAPSECPSADSVRASIHDLLGTHHNTDRPVSARATAWRGEDAAWHVRIETESRDGQGERKVDGSSCRAVADAAALIVAMAVDPDAVAIRTGAMASASASESPTVAVAPWNPSPPASSAPVVRPPPAAPRPAVAEAPVDANGTRFGVSVHMGADLGALPSLSPGWGGGVVLAPRHWQVELSAQRFATRSATVADHPSAGGDFELWTGNLGACREVVGGQWGVALCAGAEAGKLAARGYGVRAPAESSPLWLAATLGAEAQWRLVEPLSLRVTAGVSAPFDRKRYVIDPYGAVHRAAVVSGRTSLGLVVLIP